MELIDYDAKLKAAEERLYNATESMATAGAKMKEYEDELARVSADLQLKYDYEPACAEFNASSDLAKSIRRDIVILKMQLIASLLTRLTRAYPSRAMESITNIMSEYGSAQDAGFDVYWNSNVRPDAFDSCMTVFCNELHNAEFWNTKGFVMGEAGMVTAAQVVVYDWEPRISLIASEKFLDLKLPYFVQEMESRIENAARDWAEKFVSDHSKDLELIAALKCLVAGDDQ